MTNLSKKLETFSPKEVGQVLTLTGSVSFGPWVNLLLHRDMLPCETQRRRNSAVIIHHPPTVGLSTAYIHHSGEVTELRAASQWCGSCRYIEDVTIKL